MQHSGTRRCQFMVGDDLVGSRAGNGSSLKVSFSRTSSSRSVGQHKSGTCAQITSRTLQRLIRRSVFSMASKLAGIWMWGDTVVRKDSLFRERAEVETGSGGPCYRSALQSLNAQCQVITGRSVVE